MRVRITRPTRHVMQSARDCADCWYIEPIRTTGRAIDPLTGWTGAPDSLSTLHRRLVFDTAEKAQEFARARGWTYVMETPATRLVRPKSYVDNFNPDRRRTGR